MNSLNNIIAIPIVFIIIGTTIYTTKFYGKSWPKLGQTHNTIKEYLHDIVTFKAYFQSLLLSIMGVFLLFAFNNRTRILIKPAVQSNHSAKPTNIFKIYILANVSHFVAEEM